MVTIYIYLILFLFLVWSSCSAIVPGNSVRKYWQILKFTFLGIGGSKLPLLATFVTMARETLKIDDHVVVFKDKLLGWFNTVLLIRAITNYNCRLGG